MSLNPAVTLLKIIVRDVQFTVNIIFFRWSYNLFNYSIKLIRNENTCLKDELKLKFYLNYVNSNIKVVLPLIFTILFKFGIVGAP